MSELDQAVETIVRELVKPQNFDLLHAVRQLGDETPEQSFMWGFTQEKTQDFDDFARTTHIIDATLVPELGIEPDLRSMSDRYDEYLQWIEQRNQSVELNQSQTDRLDAIVDPIANKQGWSGAIYGLVMRHVQRTITRSFNG